MPLSAIVALWVLVACGVSLVALALAHQFEVVASNAERLELERDSLGLSQARWRLECERTETLEAERRELLATMQRLGKAATELMQPPVVVAPPDRHEH